jgi:hypothetical protein
MKKVATERTKGVRKRSAGSGMLKNPRRLSFRGATDDEESCPDQIGVPRGTFLAEYTLSGQSEVLRCARDDSEGLGMTMFTRLFPHPVGEAGTKCKKDVNWWERTQEYIENTILNFFRDSKRTAF